MPSISSNVSTSFFCGLLYDDSTLLLKFSLGASKARGKIILSVDDDFFNFPRDVSSPPNGSNYVSTSNNSRTPASSSNRASTNRSSVRVPHIRRFTGSVAGMNGHIFQVHNEQASKTQFLRTMQDLKTYVAQCYKSHVPLFQDEIGTPSVPKPDALPADADDIDKAGFQEDIKLWAKDAISRRLSFPFLMSFGCSVVL